MIRSSVNRKRGGYRVQISRMELIRQALAFGEWVNMVVDVEERVDPLSGRVVRSYSFNELVNRRQN
jgi:hypothetical protein